MCLLCFHFLFCFERWRAQKQLALLDQALYRSAERAQSLRQISDLTQLGFEDFASRIEGQQLKIEQFYERVAQLIERQESHINKMAIAALDQQRIHLTKLRLNARYSLARLYDSLVEDQP